MRFAIPTVEHWRAFTNLQIFRSGIIEALSKGWRWVYRTVFERLVALRAVSLRETRRTGVSVGIKGNVMLQGNLN